MTVSNSGATHIFRIGNEIHFMDDVNDKTMHDLIRVLKEIEDESLTNLDACNKAHVLSNVEKKSIVLTIASKPIKLFLTTYGGSIYAAMKAVDIVNTLKIDVHTIVSGYVASAGTLLSMAGKKRYISKHAFMLIHELRSGFWGKYSDAREHIENIDQLMALIVDYYKKHSKITEEELKETLSRDKNWGIEECIKRGIVDEEYVG